MGMQGLLLDVTNGKSRIWDKTIPYNTTGSGTEMELGSWCTSLPWTELELNTEAWKATASETLLKTLMAGVSYTTGKHKILLRSFEMYNLSMSIEKVTYFGNE